MRERLPIQCGKNGASDALFAVASARIASQCDLSCSGLPCRHLLHHIQQTIGQGAMAAPDNQRRTLAGSS